MGQDSDCVRLCRRRRGAGKQAGSAQAAPCVTGSAGPAPVLHLQHEAALVTNHVEKQRRVGGVQGALGAEVGEQRLAGALVPVPVAHVVALLPRARVGRVEMVQSLREVEGAAVEGRVCHGGRRRAARKLAHAFCLPVIVHLGCHGRGACQAQRHGEAQRCL